MMNIIERLRQRGIRMKFKGHSPIVLERLENLKEHLRKFPKTFDMRDWGYPVHIDEEHPCGTVGCLAGTLVFLERGPLSGKVSHAKWNAYIDLRYARVEAEKLLEIDSDIGHFLWFASRWPSDFRHEYPPTVNDGIRRVDYFIEHGL